MEKSNAENYCPNCGAALVIKELYKECLYCGMTMGISHVKSQTKSSVILKYKYLKDHFTEILCNRFVTMSEKEGAYTIKSNLFYAHDNSHTKIDGISLQLYYENNGTTDAIILGINGEISNNRLFIRINDKIITLQLVNALNDTKFFILSEHTFLAICQTHSFEIDINQRLPENADFSEFPIFAGRFYNAVFNRMKFLYTTEVKLWSDQY